MRKFRAIIWKFFEEIGKAYGYAAPYIPLH
jgi:hypothetical protein